jgi:outer membrane protein assembly factor BamE (lipoprotein component of BamABCDE complex)
MAMAASLEAQRSKMLALDEMAIVSLLGNPDQNELYTRNQKFYTYFLQPGPDCAANTIPGDRDTAPKKLVIRFNAMGLAKEIIVE